MSQSVINVYNKQECENVLQLLAPQIILAVIQKHENVSLWLQIFLKLTFFRICMNSISCAVFGKPGL
mgnify:CR=1 FL=1